jgi:hypothetical protein
MDISKAGNAGAISNLAAEAAKVGADGAAGADRKFSDVLAQAHSDPASPADHRGMQQAEVGRRPGPEMMGERAGTIPGVAPVDPAPKASPGPLSLQRFANDSMKAENKMDAMIAAARNGKSFSASELLAIQVEVFRYSQTVEVISRSTDKLVGAIKQTLGTQV